MFLRIMLASVLVCGAIPTWSWATTVVALRQKCPVCGETFITTGMGSWYQFRGPSRDLSDSPAFRLGGVITCPYCLFSGLRAGFQDVSREERKRLEVFLREARLDLPAGERKVLAGLPLSNWTCVEDLVGGLLARACNRLQQESAKRDLGILLHLYYDTKRRRHGELHESYRREVLTRLVIRPLTTETVLPPW